MGRGEPLHAQGLFDGIHELLVRGEATHHHRPKVVTQGLPGRHTHPTLRDIPSGRVNSVAPRFGGPLTRADWFRIVPIVKHHRSVVEKHVLVAIQHLSHITIVAITKGGLRYIRINRGESMPVMTTKI